MAPSTAPLFPKSSHVASFSSHGKSPSGGGWSSIIGIVVAIVGNILISFALNTQRYAHIRLGREQEERDKESQYRRERADASTSKAYGTGQRGEGVDGVRDRRNSWGEEEEPLLARSGKSQDQVDERDEEKGVGKDKSYLSSGWWWLGIGLMFVGECGNFLAYGFAPASIVSPLGVVALISNCLIAPWMLHEKFRKRDALGVVIAVAGCAVVVLSASGSNPKLDAGEIWRLISTWEFETYFGITALLIVALMAASNKYGDRTILIDLGLVGLFGGYTALATKGVASLLSNTIWRIVTFPVTYLLVAILGFTAVMQIKYVNRALQRFDSTQVIPTQFVMFTLSVIIGSAILYRDFERRSQEDAIKFFAGCALTFLGVYCITSGRSKDDPPEEYEGASDEDDGYRLHVENGNAAPKKTDRSVPPVTPQRSKSDRTGVPNLSVETAAGTLPTLLENPWSVSRAPAASAAIHHYPTAVRDPLRSPAQAKKPPMHATTSEPLLPHSALSEQSSHPPVSHRDPSLPRTPASERPRTPEDDGNAPRFGSIGRHSIVDILPHPSPLTNPLSNSLSVIVADSLRRGVDHLPGSSVRRRSLRTRRSRYLGEALTFSQLAQQNEGQEPISNHKQPKPTTDSDMGTSAEAERSEAEPGGVGPEQVKKSKNKFGSLLRKKKPKIAQETSS